MCGFEYFDRLFVINLDADQDRLRQMTRRCAALGLVFERHRGADVREIPSPPIDGALKPGHFGCARSHQELLRTVWERGYDRVLILEDDAVFRDDVAAWMRLIVPQLSTMPWDLFYLGCHVFRSETTASANLIRVLEGYHTHAYAVSRKAIPRLIELIERATRIGCAFDGYENPTLLKLCALPILAVQEPNYSYTLGCFVDRLAEYFGPFDRADFQAHCAEMRRWMTPQ